ncbi:SDR family NAD(P)-dependent oxidoreductase [Henriciella mobilis]|uniref:SDR family oxidoreductase n=1 Tax=Henriciella mobilis TaxID=2305467 RepID=A0A399R656_9PROT|nr:SDR family oxidoreductase [Henriciella mobilis]RIJ26840.1 SDR family oxidoreductase [Henriciella mobilis]
MLNFTNKVAVVTGGASGIGRATVKTLASLEANVVIADIDEKNAGTLIDECADLPGKVVFCSTDILHEEQIANMISHALSSFGRIDILHNNAGVPRSRAPDCEITDMTVEWWHRTIDAHLTSAMLGCKYALPHMITNGGGVIVNTSSSAAADATVDLPAYSSAKAGLHQLTREVAATYGRDNVRCNAVVPGLVLTERGRATLPAEQIKLFAAQTPLPYLAEAQDIANVVVFLASDASRMINGECLRAEGGMMIKLPYWESKLKASRGPSFSRKAYRDTRPAKSAG